MRIFQSILLTSFVMLGTACSPVAQEIFSTANIQIGSIDFHLETSDGSHTTTFSYGEEITAEYVILNDTTRARYFQKPTPGIGVTFEIFSGDEVVRTMGQRKVAVIQVIDEGLLSSGGTLVFTAEGFDGIEDPYGPAAPALPIGQYAIRAIPRISFPGLDPLPILQTTFEVVP